MRIQALLHVECCLQVSCLPSLVPRAPPHPPTNKSCCWGQVALHSSWDVGQRAEAQIEGSSEHQVAPKPSCIGFQL